MSGRDASPRRGRPAAVKNKEISQVQARKMKRVLDSVGPTLELLLLTSSLGDQEQAELVQHFKQMIQKEMRKRA
jgi:hypothetical protein